MARSNIVSRRHVLSSLVVAAGAMLGSALPASAGAARSGSWCNELTPAQRDTVIDFSLRLLDADDVFTLSALRGKPVWLQFFASWCTSCNDEAADVVRIAQKYGDAIHTVGIDVNEKPELARRYRDTHKITYPIALDETASVFHSLGFTLLPTHVFFDSTGLVSCVSVAELTAEQLDNEVAVALSRSTPPPAQPH